MDKPVEIIKGPLVNFMAGGAREMTEQVITALTEAGYVIVPREPTQQIITAGYDGIEQALGANTAPLGGMITCYKAMIAASESDDG